MSDTEFTEGHWNVHRRMKRCVTFVGVHGEENLFQENSEGYFCARSEADANLISASKDIYKALSRIIDELPQGRDWLDPDLEAYAKSALSRARGES